MSEMTYCPMCGNAHLVKSSETRNLTILGLPNILVSNLAVFTCSECGEKYRDYPSFSAFYNRIAKGLVTLARDLTGREMAYLRKHLGMKAKDWAQIINVHPVTLSEWENEKSSINKIAEIALRYRAALKLGVALEEIASKTEQLIVSADYPLKTSVEYPPQKAWPDNKYHVGKIKVLTSNGR